jgi:hypothetical protein
VPHVPFLHVGFLTLVLGLGAPPELVKCKRSCLCCLIRARGLTQHTTKRRFQRRGFVFTTSASSSRLCTKASDRKRAKALLVFISELVSHLAFILRTVFHFLSLSFIRDYRPLHSPFINSLNTVRR